MLPIHEIDTDTIQCQPEVETPVEVSEIAVPLGPFARASLAAELAAREREGSFAGEAAAAAAAAELPTTLKETLAMIREVQATVPTDKFEVKVKAIKLQRLAAHVHKLSQSDMPPRIDHAAFFRREPSPEAVARIRSLYPNAKKS